MVSQKVKVNNLIGLHLRPAGKLCNEAMKYKCLITFHYKDVTANAKSVLSVLGACVRGGEVLDLGWVGAAVRTAVEQLVDVLEHSLQE